VAALAVAAQAGCCFSTLSTARVLRSLRLMGQRMHLMLSRSEGSEATNVVAVSLPQHIIRQALQRTLPTHLFTCMKTPYRDSLVAVLKVQKLHNRQRTTRTEA
jgi:hypothetical protein